jgi:hypothetical protein
VTIRLLKLTLLTLKVKYRNIQGPTGHHPSASQAPSATGAPTDLTPHTDNTDIGADAEVQEDSIRDLQTKLDVSPYIQLLKPMLDLVIHRIPSPPVRLLAEDVPRCKP